jgi:hypothetical protein
VCCHCSSETIGAFLYACEISFVFTLSIKVTYKLGSAEIINYFTEQKTLLPFKYFVFNLSLLSQTSRDEMMRFREATLSLAVLSSFKAPGLC